MPGPLTQTLNLRPEATLKERIAYLLNTPKAADDSAELAFGIDSARDSSTKNAYRHALGTGMLAQALGANQGSTVLAPLLAKLVGYGWEGFGLRQNIEDPIHRLDTRHDLNANAIGTQQAVRAGSPDELAAVLKRLALEAPPVQPPGFFEPSPGYLTRTVR
jgi:hypothetical protein